MHCSHLALVGEAAVRISSTLKLSLHTLDSFPLSHLGLKNCGRGALQSQFTLSHPLHKPVIIHRVALIMTCYNVSQHQLVFLNLIPILPNRAILYHPD